MSRAEQTAIDANLAGHTADMLALPHMACWRRDCRRRNRCYWHFASRGEPCCLKNLTKDERRAFDELYADAVLVRDNWRGLNLIPATQRKRDLRDAAFAIVRAALPRCDRRRFAARMRARAAERPAPAGSPEAWDREAFEIYLIYRPSGM